MSNAEETVTISKEKYEDLIDRDFKLQCLENGGVDNWDWYGESLTEYWEKHEEC